MADPFPVILCFGCGFLFGGVVLAIISLATREWTDFPDGSTSGLWAVCKANGDCMPINNTAKLEGVRAMMILSVLVSGTALVVAAVQVVYAFRRKPFKKWIVGLVSCLTVIAVILALIGILVYHRNIWTETKERVADIRHGYSFVLGVDAIVLFAVALIFFLISGIIFFRTRTKEQEKDKPLPTAYYISKSPSRDVYFANKPFDDFETDPQRYTAYPSKDSVLYYNTSNLPPGKQSYGDPKILNPWAKDSNHKTGYRTPRADFLRPDKVWIA